MEYLIALLVMVTVTLVVVGVAWLAPARSRAVRRRLVDLRDARVSTPKRRSIRQREERREQLRAFVETVGERVSSEEEQERAEKRSQLVQAGYYGPNAVVIYYGARAILAVGLAIAAGLLGSLAWAGLTRIALVVLVGGVVGWLVPAYWLKRKIRARQKEIQKALADTLDILVVCVEAGLGLNQAFVRVADEIGAVSSAMSEELRLVNLEIRAGTPRDEALRHLGERTDVSDLKAMTGMLIQTDRFGTSISRALRVHADTLRTKRSQRAEEAAAKTTIKLVFPLVLFVFPAMFVVILGPALIHIFDILRGIGG